MALGLLEHTIYLTYTGKKSTNLVLEVVTEPGGYLDKDGVAIVSSVKEPTAFIYEINQHWINDIRK